MIKLYYVIVFVKKIYKIQFCSEENFLYTLIKIIVACTAYRYFFVYIIDIIINWNIYPNIIPKCIVLLNIRFDSCMMCVRNS